MDMAGRNSTSTLSSSRQKDTSRIAPSRQKDTSRLAPSRQKDTSGQRQAARRILLGQRQAARRILLGQRHLRHRSTYRSAPSLMKSYFKLRCRHPLLQEKSLHHRHHCLIRLGPAAAYCYSGLKWPPLCSKYCFGGFSRWPLCARYGLCRPLR